MARCWGNGIRIRRRGYYNGDWGNSDFRRDPPLVQVNFEESDNNKASSEIEFGDVGGWGTESEVWCYLVNRRAPDDYRDAGSAVGCHVFKVRAQTNSERRHTGKRERTLKRHGSHFWK